MAHTDKEFNFVAIAPKYYKVKPPIDEFVTVIFTTEEIRSLIEQRTIRKIITTESGTSIGVTLKRKKESDYNE